MELYHTECSNVSTIVRAHELQPTISGPFFGLHLFLVVELDIPWDDSQVTSCGESFKAWQETEFETAITAIKDARPFSELAFVVISVLADFFRCIMLPPSASSYSLSLQRTVRLLVIS